MFRRVCIFVALILALSMVLFVPKAAAANWEAIRPSNTTIVGNQLIYTTVYAERQHGQLYVNYVLSGTRSKAYKITSLQIYRYKYDGSKGAVLSYSVTPKAISKNHNVRLWRTIPDRPRARGWAGFIRITFLVGKIQKTINLMLG